MKKYILTFLILLFSLLCLYAENTSEESIPPQYQTKVYIKNTQPKGFYASQRELVFFGHSLGIRDDTPLPKVQNLDYIDLSALGLRGTESFYSTVCHYIEPSEELYLLVDKRVRNLISSGAYIYEIPKKDVVYYELHYFYRYAIHPLLVEVTKD